MLEKPDLPDELLAARIQDQYGLPVERVIFLPLGADVNTAVYRVLVSAGPVYFLKLRKGPFDDLTVLLPRFLHNQGNASILAPVETLAGQLYGSLDLFTMILYPFIEGQDAYRLRLSARQWGEFGTSLKGVHSVILPPNLEERIPHERFTPYYRDLTRDFQAKTTEIVFTDPVAVKMAVFMQSHQEEIRQILSRAGALGLELASRNHDFVPCHADIHPGNLLITASGGLFIVDWDNPMLSLKEKDLALIGGCSTWKDAQEVLLFYRGYGPAPIDRAALAYFRYERIIQDIAAYCQQLLLSDSGGADREQSFHYFASNFQPGGEIELARAID